MAPPGDFSPHTSSRASESGWGRVTVTWATMNHRGAAPQRLRDGGEDRPAVREGRRRSGDDGSARSVPGAREVTLRGPTWSVPLGSTWSSPWVRRPGATPKACPFTTPDATSCQSIGRRVRCFPRHEMLPIPLRPTDITPDWLTAALRLGDLNDATVDSVTAEPMQSLTSTMHRLHLGYRETDPGIARDADLEAVQRPSRGPRRLRPLPRQRLRARGAFLPGDCAGDQGSRAALLSCRV